MIVSNCGIRGKMLTWVREYLSGRTFKVFYEGGYSSERTVTSSVPQGSILAPVLFNDMISDLPRVDGVTMSEYADDITIYCMGAELQHVKAKVQDQIYLFHEWTKEWGLQLNQNKTKAMLFTRKKVSPPIIQFNNLNLEFVKSLIFLAVTLDAPGLLWREHIQCLRDSCISKINIMKAISGHHWGADHSSHSQLVGLRFYVL